MSKNESDSSGESRSWLDFKDPKKVAIGLGGALALLGVGIYTARNGKKLFVNYGDRRMQGRGWISGGELEEGGTAVSAAEREDALDSPNVDRDWFAMTPDGVAYPHERPGDGNRYLEAAKGLYGLIKDLLPVQADEVQADQQRAEKE